MIALVAVNHLFVFEDTFMVQQHEELIFSLFHHANENNGEHISFLEQAVLGHGVFVHLYANAPENNQQPSCVNTKFHLHLYLT